MRNLFISVILICAILMPQFAYADIVLPEDSEETSFDFNSYDFSDPSARIPNFPTDEEFFGVWDEESGAYTTEPKFNYSYISRYGCDLSKIEEYVKQGNYKKAKEETLSYYRTVNKGRGQKLLTAESKDNGLSKLLLYNMHDLVGESYRLADIFTVSGEWETVSVPMLDSVNYYIELGGTRNMPVGLYALTKDDYEAVFYSKESGENTPYLEMVVNDVTVRLEPRDDTYVGAGDYRYDNFGDEPYLYCRESGVGENNPVNSETRRSFLVFDLSEYDTGDTITYAELKINGKCVDKQSPIRDDNSYQKKIAAITDVNDNWSEDTLTYMTNATAIFSYEGGFGTKWIQPAEECNPDQVFEEHLFRFSWLPSLTKTYTNTNDEVYALALFMYLHHFIENTYNIYRGMAGGWEYPAGDTASPSLLYGGYSKSLDLSVRAANLSLYLPYYYDSEFMTPEIFCTFLKYMWSMGKILSQYWGRSEKAGNWGTYSINGFYSLIAYYPEFAKVDEWTETLFKRVEENTKKFLLSDGSLEEGSVSYTNSIITNLYKNKQLADDLGIELTYSDAVNNNIKRICTYIMSLLLPRGGDPGFGDCVSYDGNYFDFLGNVGEWIDSPELLWMPSKGKEGEKPNFTSVYYDFRKMLCMRSDWKEDALYLYTNSTGSPYSHNHWDSLEVIVAAYGDYLLIDPGFYSLTLNDLNRRWLYSSRAHNTIEINDYCQKAIMPGAGDGNCLPRNGSKGDFSYIEFNDSYDFTRVLTENYKNITYRCNPKLETGGEIPPTEPGMDCHRDILFIRPNFWIVSDYMNPVNQAVENKYTQIWHTLPGTDLSIDGQYILKEGESIGASNTGELDSQIENTQFIRGTGDGTIKTNALGASNISIVPADIDSVEPKLLRGLYSPMKGSITKTPYGVFEKKAIGTTGFDTILFPTRTGENYDIKTTPIKLALPQGAGSAFCANIKDVTDNSNEDYKFTYYVLHEVDKQKNVVFGNYKTDGMLAYYEEEQSGMPRRAIMKGGTYLGDDVNEYKLVYSANKIEDLSVEWINNEIKLNSSKEIALDELTIYDPSHADKVYLNGEEIGYSYKSNYIYFGDKPILNGSNIPPMGDSSSGTTSDNGNNQGTNTEHGSKVLESSSSGTSNSTPTATTNTSASDFENELKDHWGKNEILYLIDKGIVKGDNGSLNLSSNITRAEFLAMIIRAMGIEKVKYRLAFEDVDNSAWYADIMQTAYDNKILEGDGGKAYPDDLLTREEAVKIMLKALKTNQEVVSEDQNIEFDDEDKISVWAKPFVSKAVNLGLIKGTNESNFEPKENALREQAMVMVYRMLNLGRNLK